MAIHPSSLEDGAAMPENFYIGDLYVPDVFYVDAVAAGSISMILMRHPAQADLNLSGSRSSQSFDAPSSPLTPRAEMTRAINASIPPTAPQEDEEEDSIPLTAPEEDEEEDLNPLTAPEEDEEEDLVILVDPEEDEEENEVVVIRLGTGENLYHQRVLRVDTATGPVRRTILTRRVDPALINRYPTPPPVPAVPWPSTAGLERLWEEEERHLEPMNGTHSAAPADLVPLSRSPSTSPPPTDDAYTYILPSAGYFDGFPRIDFAAAHAAEENDDGGFSWSNVLPADMATVAWHSDPPDAPVNSILPWLSPSESALPASTWVDPPLAAFAVSDMEEEAEEGEEVVVVVPKSFKLEVDEDEDEYNDDDERCSKSSTLSLPLFTRTLPFRAATSSARRSTI